MQEWQSYDGSGSVRGYVLQGDVSQTASVCLQMQLEPSLIVADPPYGDIVSESWDRANVDEWMTLLSSLEQFNCPLYWWGGIGKPNNRPFFRFLLDLEKHTSWKARDVITWRKRRAYGKPKDYLFVREECLLLTVKGQPPPVFHVPYSEEKRGYAGFNAKYPAKSEYKRITNVWDDTEIMRGKLHPTQKAPAVCRRPIEVHTSKDDLVIDLYAGSGETSVQAAKLGRSFLAIEQSRKYCNLIVDRLDEIRMSNLNGL